MTAKGLAQRERQLRKNMFALTGRQPRPTRGDKNDRD